MFSLLSIRFFFFFLPQLSQFSSSFIDKQIHKQTKPTSSIDKPATNPLTHKTTNLQKHRWQPAKSSILNTPNHCFSTINTHHQKPNSSIDKPATNPLTHKPTKPSPNHQLEIHTTPTIKPTTSTHNQNQNQTHNTRNPISTPSSPI